MYDFHDEELVVWRSDMLGEVEEFCHSNMLSSVPRKYSSKLWLVVLLLCTGATILCSFLLREISAWASGMFGNVSAGLMASVLILLYTTHRDKNVSYYESLLPTLTAVINSSQRAFNRLYFLQRELRLGEQGHCIENYHIFAMKTFLAHKMLLDLYEQVKNADKLKYKKFYVEGDELIAHNNAVERYQQQVAIDCGKGSIERLGEFDSMYNNIWKMEMDMMRDLHRYVEYIQSNIYTMKYGKK